MKHFIYAYALSIALFIPTISIAISPTIQNNVTEDAEVTPSQKNCEYFLKTGLQNDNGPAFTLRDNDTGYTHGHLANIIKRCDSGVDIHILADSRLFTSYFPTNDTIESWKNDPGKVREFFIAVAGLPEDAVPHFYEEQNSLTVKYTDWRAFDEMYKTAKLTLGHLSENNRFWAGKQQELFHDFLYSKIESGEYGVLKYSYIDQDEEEIFIEGYFALGKSHSLDGSKETCSKECTDYFRIEAGTEFSSLEHGSNISISAEMEIATIWDALKVFTSVKAQKNESIDGTYHERALGLKFRASPQLQLVYFITKRKLPDDWSQFRAYDLDEDSLTYIGIVFRH